MEFKPIRAKAHRDYVAPKFGAKIEDGEVVEPSFKEIMADPKASKLGIEVYLTLQEQFAEFGTQRRVETTEETYRRQLEHLAKVLETFLEETLSEIERLDAAYSVGGDMPDLDPDLVPDQDADPKSAGTAKSAGTD